MTLDYDILVIGGGHAGCGGGRGAGHEGPAGDALLVHGVLPLVRWIRAAWTVAPMRRSALETSMESLWGIQKIQI